MKESLEHEKSGIALYEELLNLVKERNIFLEEFARRMIHDEEAHVSEIAKMLR